MHKDYTIVTVCNRFPREPYFCLREFLLTVFGEPLVRLGVFPEKFGGLGDKPKLLYRAIKNKTIDTKYIIFCDCFDLVFTSKPELLINAFKNSHSDIIISSEKNCFPDNLKDQYDQLPFTSSYKYLNSGMIIGETDAILTALEAMDLVNVPDDYRKEDGTMCHINDQELWQQLFLKQPVKIALDYEQQFCNTLHSVKLEDLDFGLSLIRNKETRTFPYSFHFNGNSKTEGLREPVLHHLKLL